MCNWMCAIEIQEKKFFGGQLEKFYFIQPGFVESQIKGSVFRAELKYREFLGVWLALAGIGMQNL